MPRHHSMPVPLSNVSTPEAQGLKAWAYDPMAAFGTPSAMVSGAVYLNSINVQKAITVSTVYIAVATAGSGLVAGQSFLGLYDFTGARLAQTADISGSLGATGLVSGALTGSVTLGKGRYWVAAVSNGTTPPALRSTAFNIGSLLGAINAGTTAATMRVAVNGSGTSLPANITPSSNAATGACSFWTAVS